MIHVHRIGGWRIDQKLLIQYSWFAAIQSSKATISDDNDEFFRIFIGRMEFIVAILFLASETIMRTRPLRRLENDFSKKNPSSFVSSVSSARLAHQNPEIACICTHRHWIVRICCFFVSHDHEQFFFDLFRNIKNRETKAEKILSNPNSIDGDEEKNENQRRIVKHFDLFSFAGIFNDFFVTLGRFSIELLGRPEIQ